MNEVCEQFRDLPGGVIVNVFAALRMFRPAFASLGELDAWVRDVPIFGPFGYCCLIDGCFLLAVYDPHSNRVETMLKVRADVLPCQ